MTEKHMVREAVGIFEDYDQMEKTIADLQLNGFGRYQISVLGSEAAVKEKFGMTHVQTELLEDHPDAPRSPDIKKEELALGQGVLVAGGLLTGVVTAVIASGGVLVPGIVTTAVIGGTGGTAAGAVLAKLLGDKYADFFQKQIDQGGLLLWVNTPDQDMEIKAQNILRKYGARNVHIHELPVDTDTENNRHPPYMFSKFFVNLDHIIEMHKAILYEDLIIKNKLDSILELLKNMATNGNGVSWQQAKILAKKIDDCTNYARDMGEEEQRMIAETQAEGSGKQEKELERYFALAHDLNEFAAEYRRAILKTETLLP